MPDVAHLQFNSGVYDIKDEYLRGIVNGVALSIDEYPKEEADLTDSERIQRAINYLNTLGGGSLLFPSGEYAIGETIKIYDNIKLKGNSNSGTTFNVSSNIPFIELYDTTKRHDNMGLYDLEVIRTSSETDTPLIEMSHWAYSVLENVSLLQENNQQTQTNCVGVHLEAFSYYNILQNVQIRQFNTGILAENEANGNIYIGGACLSCGSYGVRIIRTNSQRFFGHAVELGGDGVTAYKMEQRSLFNSFFGCRVEGVGKSYEALYEEDNMSSFNNMVFDGLDYSTNGENFANISNEIVNASNLSKIRNWSTKPAFKLASTRAQSVSANTPTKLNTTALWIDRASNTTPSESKFTAPQKGLYIFNVGCLCATAQENGMIFTLYVNGAPLMSRSGTKGSGNSYITDFMTNLSANDIVEVYVTLSTFSAISSGGNTTYFAGAIL